MISPKSASVSDLTNIMSVCEYKKRKPYTLDSKTDTFCLCPLLHLDVLYVPSFCDDVDDYDMGVFNDLD